MKSVIDRNVQYPNRYELKDTITGETVATYDIVPAQGEVIEEGTPINRELFESIAADFNGIKGSDGVSPTIDIEENTDTSYILKITDKNKSFVTPNLKGKNSYLIPYIVCETPDTTTTKIIERSQIGELYTGLRITVEFKYANTLDRPTLKIDDYWERYTINIDGDITYIKWKAGAIIDFVFDGTGFVIVGGYALAGKPIGSYYISHTSTSPAELFGGNWTEVIGRFLYANHGTEIGGEERVTLTIDEMPEHTHNIAADIASPKTGAGSVMLSDDGVPFNFYGDRISSTGGGQSHNNMPPYQETYAWRRTA